MRFKTLLYRLFVLILACIADAFGGLFGAVIIFESLTAFRSNGLTKYEVIVDPNQLTSIESGQR